MALRTLTALEARVLAALVEKQRTVPDSYPLSLNALTAACNQKTAREPVMNAPEADVLTALEGLRSVSLVFESTGSRVVRYEHNMARVLNASNEAVALLATLMLRGAQTAAELRANSERLHRFTDLAAVETALQALADAYPPRAVKLARAAGARESRWVHLLSGEPDAALVAGADDNEAGTAQHGDAPRRASSDDVAWLQAEVLRLGRDVAALQSELAALKSTLSTELGIATAPGGGV